MIKIEKVSDYIFEEKKNEFNLIIGSYASYNEYYLVEIHLDNSKIKIGLQVVAGGISPNVIINNNKILITAGQFFYICNKNCDVIKEYCCDASVFEMKLLLNYLIVYNEIDIICFDKNMDFLWKKEFDDLIDICLIMDDFIKLSCNNEDIIINLNDGSFKFMNS